jgi:tetratricopeptide (TPR) repeat protein
LEIDPQYADAWNNKGFALNFLGRHDEAIKAFDMAIEIESGFEEAK